MRKSFIFRLWMALVLSLPLSAQQLAVLKYDGGGDWYANPTSLPNLARFCNEQLGCRMELKPAQVSFKSDEVFAYPFLHMTGHGNVVFSEEEQARMRRYLDAGGFLHIDDNYGMDPFIRPILESLFADSPLEKLPLSSFLFQYPYALPDGLPKVHAHDEQPPQAWVIRRNGRIVLLYTYESDLGDGWEDAEVHNDPEEIRTLALKMGANMIAYAFSLRNDSAQ